MIECHNNITGVDIKITSAKLYVPVLSLSINDNIKFWENIKEENKRTNFWSRYRSETTIFTEHLEILINCLLFHSKTIMMIL